MSPKLRLATTGTTIAIATALWIGAAQVERDHAQLWVGAVLASIVALVLLCWTIVGFVKDRQSPGDEEFEQRSRPAAIKINAKSFKRNTFKDIRHSGFSRFADIDADEAEENVFENIRDVTPQTPEQNSSRRMWSFPEMPWKRKKPPDTEV